MGVHHVIINNIQNILSQLIYCLCSFVRILVLYCNSCCIVFCYVDDFGIRQVRLVKMGPRTAPRNRGTVQRARNRKYRTKERYGNRELRNGAGTKNKNATGTKNENGTRTKNENGSTTKNGPGTKNGAQSPS